MIFKKGTKIKTKEGKFQAFIVDEERAVFARLVIHKNGDKSLRFNKMFVVDNFLGDENFKYQLI